MRKPDVTSLAVETCRAAFDLRKPDARRMTIQAIERARRIDDQAQQRALAELLGINRHRRLGPDDVGPTPETLVRRRLGNRHDTVETLIRNRALNWAQQAAALQIAEVCEALTASLAVRGFGWHGSRVDGGGGFNMPERLAALYHRRYLPWARWMRAPDSLFQACKACGREYLLPKRIDACEQCGSQRIWGDRPHLALVLSIAVFAAGLEQCASRYRMRRQRALRLLKLGLDRYNDFARD
jgi:hypothetical protein